MAIIPQGRLFGWQEVENLGDLERLNLVVRTMPDEPLMRALERARGRGRDDYPVRVMWNAVLAGVVFQHVSVESLRRELSRNAQLRQVCGMDPVREAASAVPTSSAFTRFLKRLMAHQREIDRMFETLVEDLMEALPGFGEHLAIDSKAISTHARPRGREAFEKLADAPPDGRRDLDADFGKKRYRGTREDGTLWEKLVKWFGYKLHLIVDADYELPVAYEVTGASKADNRVGSRMIDDLEETHPEILSGCEALMADAAYDDTKLIDKLWEGHGVRPVLDIRNLWKDGEPTRQAPGEGNIVYDYKGRVSCVCRKDGAERAMCYQGYERDRDAQKWRCPAAVHGYECADRARCGPGAYGRTLRIPRALDRRVFTPLARPSYAWERHYAKRTSVERVNSRLDVSFGFERHFIRGQAKMRLRCSLALCVMLALALGRVREKRPKRMRSLVSV